MVVVSLVVLAPASGSSSPVRAVNGTTRASEEKMRTRPLMPRIVTHHSRDLRGACSSGNRRGLNGRLVAQVSGDAMVSMDPGA